MIFIAILLIVLFLFCNSFILFSYCPILICELIFCNDILWFPLFCMHCRFFFCSYHKCYLKHIIIFILSCQQFFLPHTKFCLFGLSCTLMFDPFVPSHILCFCLGTTSSILNCYSWLCAWGCSLKCSGNLVVLRINWCWPHTRKKQPYLYIVSLAHVIYVSCHIIYLLILNIFYQIILAMFKTFIFILYIRAEILKLIWPTTVFSGVKITFSTPL